MYLSRIKLDISLKKTVRAMNNPNIVHGAINCVTFNDKTRKLWRIDSLHGSKYLLLLSEERNDFSSVSKQLGYGQEVECKDYSPLLNRISTGSVWRFRLTANPTVKKFQEKKNKSVVMAHITTEHQIKWLCQKAVSNGFEVDMQNTLVTESKWYNFKKNGIGDNVCLLSVTYEGVLKVVDVELFKYALCNGIGREKAYGMGLLTIVKC